MNFTFRKTNIYIPPGGRERTDLTDGGTARAGNSWQRLTHASGSEATHSLRKSSREIWLFGATKCFTAANTSSSVSLSVPLGRWQLIHQHRASNSTHAARHGASDTIRVIYHTAGSRANDHRISNFIRY
jgi:hypothetical protein